MNLPVYKFEAIMLQTAAVMVSLSLEYAERLVHCPRGGMETVE